MRFAALRAGCLARGGLREKLPEIGRRRIAVYLNAGVNVPLRDSPEWPRSMASWMRLHDLQSRIALGRDRKQCRHHPARKNGRGEHTIRYSVRQQLIGHRRASLQVRIDDYLQFVMQRTAFVSGRSSTIKPSRLGICTLAREFWSITALSGIRPLSCKIYADTA